MQGYAAPCHGSGLSTMSKLGDSSDMAWMRKSPKPPKNK
jgi:hypothetical protein